ncbi:DUF6094 domain-containing protein [Alicyclobacillus dauci]|uniref:DUF6094 domain-containing protein n=1 Tax=Alicyclobacillus dauci TaxID=1475485 RepID=A0ABY6YZC0_9BACL|nr:DUF6094 domain-containing protein [Alicyclobacillus dauci]WAH35985.1 DUF6094 domain-containing protein [Alicyclobacillus dauci]
MSRYESEAKLGYFATPDTMTDKIVKRLLFKGPARLWDPCCGEGVALRHVQDNVPETSRSYGFEIDKGRAQAAAMVLDEVVPSAFEHARIDPASMQLLWLNPPYDNRAGQGSDSTRLELWFLRNTSKYVVPNGVLVFIVPRYTLTKEMVNALENRYTNLAVYRFDDAEFQAYQQVVVFGTRREKGLDSHAAGAAPAEG